MALTAISPLAKGLPSEFSRPARSPTSAVTKAGPYSHGARYITEGKKDYIYQFGIVDIEDNGIQIRVKWSGRQGADGIGDEVLLSEKDAELVRSNSNSSCHKASKN